MRRLHLFPRLPLLAALAAAPLLFAGCSYYTLKDNPVADTERIRANPPASLAVMPVINKTDSPKLDDVFRRIMYTSLSPLHYRDIELKTVDEAVASAAVSQKRQPLDLPPSAFNGNKLADGLLYSSVLSKSKFWLFFYSHIKFRMEMRMVDSRTGSSLFSDQATFHERNLYFPFSIPGIIESGVHTMWSLRDDEMEKCLGEFGQRIAKKFPDPQPSFGGQMGIDAIFVTTERPLLRAGDAVRVEVRASPGHRAMFDIGALATSQTLTEISPGIYTGQYLVKEGDLCDNCVVRAFLYSKTGESTSLSYMKDDFKIDAVAPAQPVIEKADLVRQGVLLRMNLPKLTPDISFEIYRTENKQEGYDHIGTATKPIFVDTGVHANHRYSYVITALDATGNVSQGSKPYDVVVPERGPVILPASLAGAVLLQAWSSPYYIQHTVTLSEGATLTVEPDVEINVASGARFILHGNAAFDGNDEAPISLTGDPGVPLLIFEPKSPDGELTMRGMTIADGGRGLELAGGKASLERVDFRAMKQGVLGKAPAQLKISRCTFRDLDVGLDGALGELEASFCSFRNCAKGVSMRCDAMTIMNSDFRGNLPAIENVGTSQAIVDRNYFGTTDLYDLLGLIEGPCVFNTLCTSRGSNRKEYVPSPQPYESYVSGGDVLYGQRQMDDALEAYMSAWWLKKERRVGLRLVELLKMDGRGEEAERVARTLAIMLPGDDEILAIYANTLQANGYAKQAQELRKRLKTSQN